MYFVEKHVHILYRDIGEHFHVRHYYIVQFVRRHIDKPFVVKANPQDVLPGNTFAHKVVYRNFHHGGFAAAAHTGYGDDFLPVDGQFYVTLNHVERDFTLPYGYQRFNYVLSHLLSSVPTLQDKNKLYFPFAGENIVKSFLFKRKMCSCSKKSVLICL